MPVIYYSFLDMLPEEKPGAYEKRAHKEGRRLLAQGLDEVFQLSFSPDALEKELAFSKLGKPLLSSHPDICFSISHCPRLVICAFHTSAVGADAEAVGYFPEVLPSRVYTDEEQAWLLAAGQTSSFRQERFYRLWTLKEAYVKMTGIGVDTDLRAFSFTFMPQEDTQKPCCSEENIACFQRLLPSGHIISLCYPKPEETVHLIITEKTGC